VPSQPRTSSPQRPTAFDAVAAGRHSLLRGRRVDVGDVADAVGVSRTTVHRWFGSRDRLLGEVLFSMSDATFRAARDRTRGHGAPRVLRVLDRYMTQMCESEPFRTFLRAEPETAARVLLTPRGDVERRVVEAVADLLEEEEPHGLTLTPSRRAVAYSIVRVGEAFLYADILSGGEPNVEHAVEVFASLLRV
jgi:AcrR family transcriptional regulator